nr:glycosyltransferase family 1 protein [Maliibacterium massiliense]
MKIAFDVQLLTERQKTGIGMTAQRLIEGLVSSYRDAYLFNYFTMRKDADTIARLRAFSAHGKVNECRWFHDVLYKMLWNFLPLPYAWFFGREADVTHFMNYHVPPGVHGKVAVTVYDMVYKRFPETMNFKTKMMLNMSMKRSIRRADTIIAISEFTKREIMHYMDVPAEKIAIVPCGVDLDVFKPAEDAAAVAAVQEKYGIWGDYFLYLGTLEPRKNIERLVEAYARYRARCAGEPARLVLAGRKGWLYDTIFARVEALRLKDAVIFTDYIADGEAPLLLSGAMGFVFPSIYEGFGMPPLEAMACGTPVITANAASLPEVVGNAALLVDPYDVDDIAQAMMRLAQDAPLRAQLRKDGLARARQFTWARAVEKLHGVYEDMCRE